MEYPALLAGEIIHIVKCVVEVILARTFECYEQFPVLRGNILSANVHIDTHGTQIICNLFAPIMYLLGDA